MPLDEGIRSDPRIRIPEFLQVTGLWLAQPKVGTQ